MKDLKLPTTNSKERKKYSIFVANRALEILGNSSMDQWRHVKGVQNPADIETRKMAIEGLR